MRSSSSTALATVRNVSSASVRLSSPSFCSGSAQTLGLLDCAAEHLMVYRDFRAAVETCERGLDGLGRPGEQGESGLRNGELKAALCIVGIQALAELNQWRRVLPWILQQYNRPEKIPAKIMQMCILLYAKVGEPATMEEKRELVLGDAGGVAFNEDQRQTALGIIEKQEGHDQRRQSSSACPPSSPEHSTALDRHEGTAIQRLEILLRLMCRGLSIAKRGLWSSVVQRALLAAFLLYLILVRLDPALPLSFPWISHLLQILRQMWNAMFAPFYRANSMSLR